VWSASFFNSYQTSTLGISGSLGYARSSSESGTSDASITSTTVVNYRFARATASIAIDSGFAETFAEGENSGLVQTRGVVASLSYPITPALSGSISAFYRDNTGVGSSSGTTNTIGATASATFRLTNWLNFGLDLAHTEVGSSKTPPASNVGSGDYTENRARISLNAAL
jgi:uncharacterized protein (PEP-CTERM system associated)